MADDDPCSLKASRIPELKTLCERRKPLESPTKKNCSELLNTRVIMKQRSNESQQNYKREDYFGSENKRTGSQRQSSSCERSRPTTPKERRLSHNSLKTSSKDPVKYKDTTNCPAKDDTDNFQSPRNSIKPAVSTEDQTDSTRFQTAQNLDYCGSDDAVSSRLDSSECPYDDANSKRSSKNWAANDLRECFEHKLISRIRDTAKDICESSCECVHNERIRIAQEKATWYKRAAIALLMILFLLLVIVYKMGIANGVYYEKIYGYGVCYDGFWWKSNCDVGY